MSRPQTEPPRRVEALVRFAFTRPDCEDEDAFIEGAADRAWDIAATLENAGLATIEEVTLR